MSVGDILTQVGPGTPMGTLMRQYWMPALLSSELKSDGAPVRLKLLGEQLIAFRDTNGRVGILDHVCPHRCASLFFGRNEENGIRCVYHGWKFSAQGKCVDPPNLPDDRAQREKISIKAWASWHRVGLHGTEFASARIAQRSGVETQRAGSQRLGLPTSM